MKSYLKYILLGIYILVGIVIGLVILALLSLAGCAGNKSPFENLSYTYTSDIDPNAPINTHLLKVSDSWAKEYGTSHESVLKYNTVAAWAFAQRALQQIAVLDKRIKVLEPVVIDPNEEKIITYNESGGREEWLVSERMIDGQPIKWLQPVDPNGVKE